MPDVTVALAYGFCGSFPALYLFLGCIPAEEMQLVMKHVPGCSAVDVDEMIQAIDRQGYDLIIREMVKQIGQCFRSNIFHIFYPSQMIYDMVYTVY